MSDQQSAFKKLLIEAKTKGFLIHEDLINILPNNLIDADQIEDVISRLNEIGVKVLEVPPDENTLILDENNDTSEMPEAVEVLTTETRTTDPVRMYMREMGSVALLTREGEIKIAKRIEDGIRQVTGAFVQYPAVIDSIIEDYDRIIANEGRISDIITDFFDLAINNEATLLARNPEELAALSKPAVKAAAEEKKKTEAINNAQTTDDDEKKPDENKTGDENNKDTEEEEEIDTGPDPIVTAEKMANLVKLHKKYVTSLYKNGRKFKRRTGQKHPS